MAVYWCSKIRRAFLISLVILSFVGYSECGKYEDELILTTREKEALERFKAKVIPQIPMSSYIQNYIRDDLYFIRWLRAGNVNVDLAQEAFLNHLKWRNEERMDTVDDEDWEDFPTQFPMFVDTEDRKGQPLVEAFFGDFRIREGVTTRKTRKILRWILRGFELANRKVYKARAAGKEVSQVVLLADIHGFNIPQHGCPGCLRIFIMLALGFELHFPNLLDTSFIVNMPPTFDAVLNIVRPLVSQGTRATINTFGRRQDTWLSALDAQISRDQRSVRFGGNIRRDKDE